MKQLIFTILFANVLLTFFAQELPDVPLKNGLAYYKFDHKLENTNNKCISSYFLNSTLQQKIGQYGQQLTMNKTNGYNHNQIIIKVYAKKNNINCNDTLVVQNNGFNLFKSGGEIDWRPAMIELMRKKILNYDIKASIAIVFTSKNEYTVYIKNVNCNIYWSQGLKTGMDIYDIGELYTQTKESGKITKKDIKFFEELNYFIKATDEIILKSLTETINLDQL
jgi:hypothetical protein